MPSTQPPKSRSDMFSECERVGLRWWQCPPFLFVLMGLLTIVTMVFTAVLTTTYFEDPEMPTVFAVTVVAVLRILAPRKDQRKIVAKPGVIRPRPAEIEVRISRRVAHVFKACVGNLAVVHGQIVQLAFGHHADGLISKAGRLAQTRWIAVGVAWFGVAVLRVQDTMLIGLGDVQGEPEGKYCYKRDGFEIHCEILREMNRYLKRPNSKKILEHG